MVFIVFTLLSVMLIALLYKWSVANYNVFNERGVPHRRPVPLLGNVPFIGIIGRLPFLQQMIDQHMHFRGCKIYGVYALRQPMYFLRDAELIKTLTIGHFEHFVNHHAMLNNLHESILAKSLIALRGRKWKEMRNMLTPAFTGSKMRGMFQLINECCLQGVQFVAAEAKNSGSDAIELEMKEFFTRFANDVIASAAFGIQVNSFRDKHNEFYTIGQSITQLKGMALFKAILFQLMPRIMRALGITMFSQQHIDYFRSLVFDAMAYRKQHNIVRPDMIQLLMQTQQKLPQGAVAELMHEDILAQCMLFFFAGFETVATCLCFASYELCMHSEVQSQLYAEILSVEQELQGSSLDYDTLGKMKYMDMVIAETLRKWPPGIATDRECNDDLDIHDPDGQLLFSFKKGDVIQLPIFALHHDPNNFEQPEDFLPERFSPQQKQNIKPFTYLPFGSGPRNCIGNRLAIMEMKAAVYHLLLNFRLVAAKKTAQNMLQSIVGHRLQPKELFWVKCVQR